MFQVLLFLLELCSTFVLLNIIKICASSYPKIGIFNVPGFVIPA